MDSEQKKVWFFPKFIHKKEKKSDFVIGLFILTSIIRDPTIPLQICGNIAQ